MVGLLSDNSLDGDGGTELKVPSSAVDNTVPNISELDFSSPLFDSLPDFETLKDYWMESPGEEGLDSGKENFFQSEEVIDMVVSESGVGIQPEAKKIDSLAAPTEGGQNERESHVVNVKKEDFKENERSSQGRAEVETEDGDIKLEQEELEEVKSLNIGNVDVWSAELGENEALEELKNAQKMKTEVSGCLSLTIEEDMRKVTLDEPGGVSVAGCGVNVKAERKTDEDKNDSSDDAESESESSLYESSSSISSSSSDDGEVVRRNAELAGLIEEGEIIDEDVQQMVAWSDDDDDVDDEVMKGPIRSKNEITDLPPVPKIDVTLSPNHQTLPVGVILSIVGKQVIVEGGEKHNPLNEGSILWITESRMPLGLIDDIFGPVENPYYLIRYNNDDEVPSGISVGTPVSFVAEFASHVLNDPSLYKKGYDASNENDEELSDDTEFSDDEKEAEYRRMLKLSKRGSNEEAMGKKKKDKRNQRNQERNRNNQRPSPQLSSNEANFPASHDSQRPLHAETPGNHNKFSWGSQDFPLSAGMTKPFQHVHQPATFNLGSNGMWPNGMPVQQQQQPMFFPSPFPTNGMPWMQQNNLIHNPYMSMPMPMPMPNGMSFSQQFGPNQMLPRNFVSPMGQQIFMGNNSDSSFPGFFSQNNFGQGNGQPMATTMPGVSMTDNSFSERNDAVQRPSNSTGSTENVLQVRPDMSFSHGRNSNTQWRGRSGSRGGRFGRGRGSGGRGRGHQ